MELLFDKTVFGRNNFLMKHFLDEIVTERYFSQLMESWRRGREKKHTL
jgi:hypothetical protein